MTRDESHMKIIILNRY